MKHTLILLAASACLVPSATQAQCPVGELEVTIQVTTDDFGYESYWQLLPSGNPCGTGTIFTGGNPNMECSGGGWQLQQPGGYDGNTTYTEGPWCLTAGANYDIFSVDDWGDGQPLFEVFVDGVSIGQFQQPGATNIFTFNVQLPVARDMSVTALNTPIYTFAGEPVTVTGKVKSFGADTVTTFELNYSIDAGPTQTATYSGLNMEAGDVLEFTHSIPWTPALAGPYSLRVWPGSINGSSDLNPVNDQIVQTQTVNAPIPNIIDQYLIGNPVVEVIANSNQDLLVPRDLDFHPDLARNELWVINKDVETSGGSTVKFTNAGEPGMDWLWQRDQNAWHFMSLPTGIAFGDNGNFSTCPGVFDANHNGGTPFTGPTLWSSDTAIYAQPIFGGLGSHLDMLHVDPNSQGIAHERWNRYWVVDGFNGDIVMNDYREDHGPGNDYHGNALIRRYSDFTITKDPNDHVVSHCVLDKHTNWLYVVDHGGQRVMRLDITSGAVSGPATYGPWESYAEYSQMTGTTWEEVISTGLVEPAGIDVIDDRLLVSDFSNGDIVIYDISGNGAPEIGRIHTNTPGLMGIKVGPDGRVWGVNATTHELIRASLDANVGVAEVAETSFSVRPNPANGVVWISAKDMTLGTTVELRDALGRLVLGTTLDFTEKGLDLSRIPAGSYSVRIGSHTERLVIEH